MYKNIQCIKQMVDGRKLLYYLPITKILPVNGLTQGGVSGKPTGFESFDTISLM